MSRLDDLVRRALLLGLTAGLLGPALASAAQRCEVTIGIDGLESLGGLEVVVGYEAAPGAFAGSEDDVECVALAEGAYSEERDDEQAEELRLALVSAIGVSVPEDLWRCAFEAAAAAPVPGQFQVSVAEAVDPLAQPVVAEAAVTSIVCDSSAVCGNGKVEGDEECDDLVPTTACNGDCTLTRNSQRCRVLVRANGAGSLGGLQFRLGYGNAGGDFEGIGLEVACSETVPSSLTMKEDRDADDELRLALVSPSGIALPADLWGCVFVTAGALLQPQEFDFTAVEAVDTAATPIGVELEILEGDCVSGPYCGDGIVDPFEQCDDGNQQATDACTPACVSARCGDGFVRAGVEACDDGNSVNGDCCSNTCVLAAPTTVCRAAAGVCDLAENCSGASGVCPADLRRTTVCRAASGTCDPAEVCTGTAVTCPANVFTAAGTSCTTDDNLCTTDQCDGTGSCLHTPNTLACDDGAFCNGADTCKAGSCSQHVGSPCPGADGDSDCTESCSEPADACIASDPNGSTCNDGNPATTGEKCSEGVCLDVSAAACGDADASGGINASDALRILRAAVGIPVSCPLFRCDTDDSGSVQATDALRVLRKAVDIPEVLDCPAP